MRYYKKPIVDPRVKGELVGMKYQSLIRSVKKRMLATDDNCVVVCGGDTGAGKSSLMFHTAKIYNEGELMDVDRVAFDEQTWAEALYAAKDAKGAFLARDEANINKRSSMSKENKMFINLLYQIRSKNWFIWLNNPSVNALDKDLITDNLINFYIYIYAKQRRFWVFNRKQMLDFYNIHGDLKGETIRKHAKHWQPLDSYFYKYTGEDWDEYLVKKNNRTDEGIDAYYEEFGLGDKKYGTSEVGNMLGVTAKTIQRYLNQIDDEDFLEGAKNAVGHWKLDEDRVDYLREFMGGKEDLRFANVAASPHTHKTREEGDSSS